MSREKTRYDTRFMLGTWETWGSKTARPSLTTRDGPSTPIVLKRKEA